MGKVNAAGTLNRSVHRARQAAENAMTSLTSSDTAGPAAVAAAPSAPTAALTDTPPVVPAKLGLGMDLGPACDQCGGMMQRTGACYTCSSCGNNTGCG